MHIPKAPHLFGDREKSDETNCEEVNANCTPSQTEAQFLLEEYRALRAEILDTRARLIQFLSIALTGIPLLIGGAKRLEIKFIIIVSPLIVTVSILMLLCEQNNMMRAGNYIKDAIEPFFRQQGWEHFLKTRSHPYRGSGSFFLTGASLALGIYYLGGSVLAYFELVAIYNETIGKIVAFIYGSGFFFLFYFFVTKFLGIGQHGIRARKESEE